MDQLITSRIKDFGDAFASLKEAIVRKDIDAMFRRDTALLRFELAAEFAPKVTRQILDAVYSVQVSIPKEVFREALQARLVSEDDTEMFLEMVDDRNRMVHDYNERFADTLFKKVVEAYAPVPNRLYDTLRKKSERE